MHPINELMKEHRLIEQVLTAMEGYMQALAETGTAPRETLARFAEFFREYADRLHHAKEEDILFVAMEAHGFSRQTGPVAAMLQEHDQGRALVKVLREAGERAAQPWTQEEIEQVISAAGHYTHLLSAHIEKEDNILYPMAMEHLPDAAMKQMTGQFMDAAQRQEHSGEAARLAALANGLIQA